MPYAAITHQLVDALMRNSLVVFVGAGLSVGSGLPTWASLIAPLATELGCKTPKPGPGFGEELLRIAGHYEDENGRNALVRKLRAGLDIRGAVPNAAHAALAALFPRGAIVTTNYDDLIERSYRDASLRVQPVVADSNLPYWDGGAMHVIKLRGDLDNPESLVVTQRDYDTHPLSHPLLVQQTKSLLVTHTPLFVGYSHSDPDTALILHQLQFQLGIHMRQIYSVQFDMDDATRSAWQRDHSGVVAYNVDSAGRDRTTALAELLVDLRHQARSGRK